MTDLLLSPADSPRWAARTAFALRFLLAIAFLLTGGAKLAGLPAMKLVFAEIGIGQWFRYVTGTVEIVGAVLLVVRGTIGLGAALLSATMACALLTHLLRIGGNPTPAIALLLLSGFVYWVHRGDLTRFATFGRKVRA